jgi:aryl-alcohol dehydrogenase-like predicted oxidoreductase
MKYRRVGRLPEPVSVIGFGAWGIGGTSYGPTDDAESRAALQCALDKGVNFFDTADLYGDGRSEQLVGSVLKERRSEVVIATKGGTLPHSGFDMPQDFSFQYLVEALERSLKNLSTDYVDLYQLHSPDLAAVRLDEVERFREYGVSKGMFRAFGVSVRNPKDGLQVLRDIPCDAIQVNYNLAEIGLDAECAEKGVGIIARTPLCFGFLTGRFGVDSEFEEGDHRKNWSRDQVSRWADSVDLFRGHMNEGGLTPTHYALLFCLANSRVSTVIPGMLSTAHVIENTQVVELDGFSERDLSVIAEIYRHNTFYDPAFKRKAIVEERISKYAGIKSVS